MRGRSNKGSERGLVEVTKDAATLKLKIVMTKPKEAATSQQPLL